MSLRLSAKKFWYCLLGSLGLLLALGFLINQSVQAFAINALTPIDTGEGKYINIMTDAQGTTHIVYYMEEITGNYVYYAHSNTNNTFSQPIPIGEGQNPVLTVSPDGTVHIAWDEEIDSFNRKINYATDQGIGTFVTTTVATQGTLSAAKLAIVAGDNGVHLLYTGYGSGFKEAIYHTENTQGTFTEPLVVAETDQGVGTPEAVLDSEGHLHLVCGGKLEFGGDQFLLYTHNKSGDFADLTPIIDTDNVFQPDAISLSLDGDGKLYVAYEQSNGVYYTSNYSGTFGNPLEITSRGTDPRVFLDEDGTTHIIYAGAQAMVGSQGVMYTNNKNGDFDYPVRLYKNYHDQEAYGPHWCLKDNHFVHAGLQVWSAEKGDYEVGYLLIDMNDPQLYHLFNEFQAITDDGNARTDASPAIDTDSNNNTYIAYISVHPQIGAPDGVAGDIMVTDNTSGTFSTPITITGEDMGGYYSKSPALFVDTNDTTHVAFLRTTGQFDAGGQVYYTHNAGGSFTEPITIVQDAIWNVEIVADSQGTAHIVYCGEGESGDSYYYYTHNYSGEFTNTLTLGTASSFGYFSLAIDPEDHIHIVWLSADENLYYANNISTPLTDSQQISIANTSTDTFSDPNLAADNQGNAHIAYRSAADTSDLVYMNNIGGSFGITVPLNGRSSNSFKPAITVDGLGHVHMLYLGKDNYGGNQLEYRVDRGNSFGEPELIATGDVGAEGHYIVIDNAYQAHIAIYAPINNAYADIYYLSGFVGDFHRITGYARNDDGEGLEEVTITVTDANGKIITTTTDSRGYFSEGGYAHTFANGTYTVTATREEDDIFIPAQYNVTLGPSQALMFSLVEPIPNCPKPLQAVTISGPLTGETATLYTGNRYTFEAVLTPPDATTPLTYTWSPAPDNGQGSYRAGYQWEEPGAYTISLIAENCGGKVTTQRTVTVEEEITDYHNIFLPLLIRG